MTGRKSPLGTFWVDGRGTLLAFDQGMDLLSGWNKVFPRDRPLLRWPDKINLEQNQVLELYDAEDGTLLVSAKVIREPLGDRYQIFVESIINHQPFETQEKLPRDSVTGWRLETAFRSELRILLERSRFNREPCALIVCDVDHMRRINDRFGRNVGDQALQSIAKLAEHALKPSLCGRLKGDRLAVAVAGIGLGETRRRAAQFRRSIEQFPFMDDQGRQPFGLTVSIGSANAPNDAESEKDLLKRAEEALAEAWSQGGNRVWCYIRRPRVPFEVPIYFEGRSSILAGFSRDLSHSGLFIQTANPLASGMRCALQFEIPGHGHPIHVLGRIVRTIESDPCGESIAIPGMAIEFEQFAHSEDRTGIDRYLHAHAANSERAQHRQSIPQLPTG